MILAPHPDAHARATSSTVSPYRGRFAPSPTGSLHFGSLIAALGSFLRARQAGGEWLLRIEDIDTPRVVPGAADRILRTLENHGLHWDGRVEYQSLRGEAYAAALESLLAAGWIYPCSCSRREIAKIAQIGPLGPIYPGHCRRGPLRPDRPCALRVITDDREIVFDDQAQGRIASNLRRDSGDFVLRRSDGLAAYQLAVVIDDAHQGVSEIVRGADLLFSTPRQIHLQRLLGLSTPAYLHLPLAVDDRGRKLSKSGGAAALDARRPGANLVRALEFLGQDIPAELHGAGPDEILDWAIAAFRADAIPRVHSRPAYAPR